MGRSRAFSRRTFLREGVRAAAVLGGAGLLARCSSGSSRGAAPRAAGVLERPAAEAPFDHVVVVMMENRSFDHWLGWLAADEHYVEQGRRRYGRAFHVNGAQQQTYAGPSGPVATRHLLGSAGTTNPWRGCGYQDPGHSWNDGRAQRDGGFLAPGSGNDELAVSYYLGDDLPFASRLARRFTTFDDYHASLLSSTFPNREYLHSAQSGGHKDNALPDLQVGFQWETIWDRLARANVPSGYYYTDLPVLGLWGPRMLARLAKVDDYFDRCHAGTLPNVVMVDPGFVGVNETDDHPLGDVHAGQRFLRDVFQAFATSPHWERGVFVLTYDEWGGFFDHVAPPLLPDDRASADDAQDFGQAGFRVPAVVASPFAQPGYVDHRVYDHTSVLRMLEWRFLGAPPEGPGAPTDTWFLTARDRHAANLASSLVRRPRPGLGFDLDFEIPATSPACAGDQGGGVALGAPAAGAGADRRATGRGAGHSMEALAESPYLESIGYRGAPSAMTGAWVRA